MNVLQEARIHGRIRRSEFKLPLDPKTPILMIASGTGVAPFRAFVQERMRLKEEGKQIGNTTLLVGHRSCEDLYYNDLWQEASVCLGDAFQVHFAFSRTDQRTYVQDLLRKRFDSARSVLDQHSPGVMYICGSSRMARGVKSVLKELWQFVPSDDKFDADSWLTELSRVKRLQEDSWG